MADELELPNRRVVSFDVLNSSERMPPRLAMGIEIGRLFVRAAFEDEIAYTTNEHVSLEGFWVLECGDVGVMAARSLALVLLAADEVSRWCADALELAIESPERMVDVLGHDMIRWLEYISECESAGRQPLDYRRWMAR